eukprot:TRINITY_DN63592_c0_g1_i1.p1 TRINITY_DN63592_c0_g1~~TRINITY_DN63592_c0_g1_i1.p1  ORF type:complete len:181 (+),score=36.43 TRINITY_DN63592_c0_g1_i1:86-628(+)
MISFLLIAGCLSCLAVRVEKQENSQEADEEFSQKFLDNQFVQMNMVMAGGETIGMSRFVLRSMERLWGGGYSETLPYQYMLALYKVDMALDTGLIHEELLKIKKSPAFSPEVMRDRIASSRAPSHFLELMKYMAEKTEKVSTRMHRESQADAADFDSLFPVRTELTGLPKKPWDEEEEED